MESDSEKESIEGDIDEITNSRQPGGKGESSANWGKAKFDYYFTDYVDKDYPSGLTHKEERLASIEQEEAQRIQRQLFSNLDAINLQPIIDYDESDILTDSAEASQNPHEDIIEFIETQNKSILDSRIRNIKSKKTDSKTNVGKSVKFDLDQVGSDEQEFDSDDDENDEEEDDDEECQIDGTLKSEERRRRPINMSIKKNRGLTPYKKKEYRNPRVKHKLKYKKAMTKRRKLVKEAQTEFYRYSGETTGIKTSTVKSIRLC